ncbi:MAG: hypothetical protein E1N59_1800 [Puniceicoccaceae bacterium 5H]|nr:MAG: hypothetical protein E1N59_1800 [Puniceicoccaceae bacterium 5H]
MKVLILVQGTLDRRLGGPRLPMDLATELRELGVEVAVESAHTLRQRIKARPGISNQEAARRYLQQYGPFDLVDYDHLLFLLDPAQLPVRLGLARVSLLLLHLTERTLPRDPRPRSRLKMALQPWRYRWREARQIRDTLANLQRAHGVLVNNARDAERIARAEVDREQTAVVLPGCQMAARHALEAVAATPKADPPVVAFVGTFDFRKGCLDLVQTFWTLRRQVPGVRLRLLGTKGQFQTEAAVRAFFPAEQQETLEVVPQFAPEALPDHLADVSLGLFPSYLESFGYGALEMAHAGIPVLAYDVPGPSAFLPPSQLVPAGRVGALATLATALLTDPALREAAIKRQSTGVQALSAEQHARQTLEVYEHWLTLTPKHG